MDRPEEESGVAKEVVLYNSDGAIVNELGRIIKPGRSAFTKANAAENARKSHEKRRQNAIEAATEGILAGIPPGTLAKTVWGGMKAIIQAQTQLALDIDKGSASTQAAKFVLEQADILVKDEVEEKAGVKLSLNENTAMKLAALLMNKNSTKAKDQIIDA